MLMESLPWDLVMPGVIQKKAKQQTHFAYAKWVCSFLNGILLVKCISIRNAINIFNN